MRVHTLKSALKILAPCLAGVASALSAATPAAAQGIINRPGDHPRYSVEIEPHFVAGFISPIGGSSGLGPGGRFSIPIVENGFVPSINNNVAIGFGIDWLHYNGCWRNYAYFNCNNIDSFWFPGVMQWNFFFTPRWSAFGEIGAALYYVSWGDDCYDYVVNNQRIVGCYAAPRNHVQFDGIIAAGGRFHITEKVALTGRVGYPYFSFGVSIMP
jgi:hypothetical protein